MSKLVVAAVVNLICLTLIANSAFAGWRDRPNSGVCKSGRGTYDLKYCKENGGKR